MLAVALVVLAFGSGSVLTYFVMDGPRRKVEERAARVRADMRRVEDREVAVEAWAGRVSARERQAAATEAARERQAAATEAAAEQRAASLAAAIAQFDRRVIAYDELAAENRILKGDLRNVAVALARHECQHEADRDALIEATAARDRLAAAYLDEAVAAAHRGLTPSSYLAAKERVRAAFARVRSDGAAVPPADEARALANLHAQYERAVRAAVERDEQARLRERIRDELRRERDAREAVERAEREERAVREALNRALADAAGRHAGEVERLKAQLAEAEARSRRAISMAEITKSGYVYVISNHGSFGPDVVKIGLTRRLDPLERVHELSGAAVPFPFDVHLMVTCDDAPRLEAALHRHFHRQRVNKVNPRKEFFRVTVDAVADAVRSLHGEVEYRADADALEYLQSQRMTDTDLAEVEDVYAAAEAGAGNPDGDED